jgi:hypothetical protein
MVVKVSPVAPSPWVQPNGQPVPAYYQYNVTLANAVSNLQKSCSTITPLPVSPTTTQIVTAVNAIIAALTGP